MVDYIMCFVWRRKQGNDVWYHYQTEETKRCHGLWKARIYYVHRVVASLNFVTLYLSWTIFLIFGSSSHFFSERIYLYLSLLSWAESDDSALLEVCLAPLRKCENFSKYLRMRFLPFLKLFFNQLCGRKSSKLLLRPSKFFRLRALKWSISIIIVKWHAHLECTQLFIKRVERALTWL